MTRIMICTINIFVAFKINLLIAYMNVAMSFCDVINSIMILFINSIRMRKEFVLISFIKPEERKL